MNCINVIEACPSEFPNELGTVLLFQICRHTQVKNKNNSGYPGQLTMHTFIPQFTIYTHIKYIGTPLKWLPSAILILYFLTYGNQANTYTCSTQECVIHTILCLDIQVFLETNLLLFRTTFASFRQCYLDSSLYDRSNYWDSVSTGLELKLSYIKIMHSRFWE